MAALVSHAMRRFPITPDTDYTAHGYMSTPNRTWPHVEVSESSLSRSMRYAEPWLYGSVRGPSSLLLTPALVICSCADYLNGTKTSSKKGPSTCKKCKGTRIPLSNLEGPKFGTVRCYPTAPVSPPALTRAGTVRVTSKSRPSILPTSDPYDLMRRSRLSASENGGSQFRARSISPSKKRTKETRSSSTTRAKSNTNINNYTTLGRKSILECNVNPYDLMNLDLEPVDASITLVSGQRVRVRPQAAEHDYEDIEVQRPPNKTTKNENYKIKAKLLLTPKSDEKESQCNRFKSILKKPATTFSDTDLNDGPERSPSPAQKSGSYFYLPMPPNTPRKKVQFLVEHELLSHNKNERHYENYIPDFAAENAHKPNFNISNKREPKPENECVDDKGTENDNSCKLRRSVSERVPQEITNVTFYDTMALRSRMKRNCTRNIFIDKELEKLDGTASAVRLRRFENIRPRGPPPQPPKCAVVKAPKGNNTTKENSCPNNVTEVKQYTLSEETSYKDIGLPETHSEKNTENIQSNKVLDKTNTTEISNTNGSENRLEIDINESSNVSLTSQNILSAHAEMEDAINTNKVVFKNLSSHSSQSNFFINEQEIDSNQSSVAPAIDDEQHNVCIRNIPPSPPPRKRSNHKQISFPATQIVKVVSPIVVEELQNKTIIKVNTNVRTNIHKLKIKNESPDVSNNRVATSENNQGKTSVMINGDDCYCTVNVNDNIPIYQSSVVVNDLANHMGSSNRKSSYVYITGSFTEERLTDAHALITNSVSRTDNSSNITIGNEVIIEKLEAEVFKVNDKYSDEQCGIKVTKNEEERNYVVNENNVNGNLLTGLQSDSNYENEIAKNEKEQNHTVNESVLNKNEHNETYSAEMLSLLLNDPVEAVKRNLIPHVCGKSSVSRKFNKNVLKTEDFVASFLNESPLGSAIDDFRVNSVSQLIEESFIKLRNRDISIDGDNDAYSEHSSSTQYEIMDQVSDCYTDNSNRSSVTEEELNARSKFYELLAESAVEVSESDDHHYECIRANSDPIYEEIEIPPPLPNNPPPTNLLDDLDLDKEFTSRSIFEGASKYDILSYLVDAKERGIVPEDSYTFNFNNTGVVIEDDGKEHVESYNRASHISTVSDSSEESSLVTSSVLVEDKIHKSIEVERNDSGVGSETSKSSFSKYRSKPEPLIICEDCDGPIDLQEDNEPLICRKCFKKRSERKEIITEIVETEEKYGRDLQIILEEFYQPMLVAGLLTSEQLSAIFLNVEELLENSQALAERLRDAVEIAAEQGDEDLLTVNIGKLFLEAAPMLHAFETYCVRQGAASLLLASLEKEKELLRIFLRVSQMENTVLRRMNLNSFLMVPVQRVTKYPLLLARLYKVTPMHHGTREQLKEAQIKIELHLNHMNSETKDVPSKLWRRISNNPGRRSSSEMDLVNIKLRKIAVDVLEWNHDEAKFALEGKLLFTQPTDNNWRKGRTIKLTPINALLVTNGKISSSINRPDPSQDTLIFSRHSGVREAALLLVRDKNGRYSLLREPLYLDRCVTAADPAWQSYFEVQELLGKDTFIFKAENEDQTRIWYQHLQYYSQGMGAWRKRRNALANIMINGMGLRS